MAGSLPFAYAAPAPRFDLTTGDYIETGDLPQLARHGQLRVLVVKHHEVEYPTRVPDAQHRLVYGAAEALGLDVVWVEVDKPQGLAEGLLSGRGDLAIGMLPADTGGPPPGIKASVSLGSLRYQVIARADDAAIPGGLQDLRGRKVAVRASSPLWPLLERLGREVPGIDFHPVPEYVDADTLLDNLADTPGALAVLGSTDTRPATAGREDVVAAFDLTEPQPIAWYMRASSWELREAVDHYLSQYQLAHRPREVYRADLPSIRERGVLRVITRPDPENFFIDKGRPAGFEYELLSRFAASQKLTLETLLAADDEEMLAWLREGRGDMIAPPVDTYDMVEPPAVERSVAYHYVAPVVIARTWDAVARPEDLRDRRFVLPRTSPHWRTLERLRASGIPLELVEAPAIASPRDLVAIVADGSYDLTVVDGADVKALLAGRPDLKAAMSLPEDARYRWTVRAGDEELLAAINTFIARFYGSADYHALLRRYVDRRGAEEPLPLATISPFDDIVRASADRYGFDWRLILSVMYQESRFVPNARSHAGASGLMQVLPSTAKEMGIHDLDEPRQAIRAGVQYLDSLRKQFGPELGIEDQTWFAVAAYHAGFSRVERARREAERMGLNPDRWFDNVELAMLRIAGKNRGESSQGAFGRTVSYVRDVRSRYDAYVQVTDPILASSGGLRLAANPS